MAMATSTMVGLGLAAAAAGAQAHNTRQTAKRQDQQAAQGIRQQGVRQQAADAKVNENLAAMEGSTAEGARAQRFDEYMDGLRRNRGSMQAGLAPTIGSRAFRDDSARAADDVQSYGERTAGLMSRMDAPSMQRQSEAFGMGNLATDIGLIGRQSAGDSFIDDLRMRAIRRNPWIDAAAQVGMSAGGAMAAGGGGGQMSSATGPAYTPVQYGGKAVYSSARTQPGMWGMA